MAKRVITPKVPVHRLSDQFRHRPVSIVLVGCGGNGSMMLTRLARLDFALRECGQDGLSTIVFDPDTVSKTNVGRQCFSPSDIGVHKAAVCVHRLNAFYGTSWHASPTKYPGYIEGVLGEGSMTAPDILISCVDTAKARRELALQFKSEPRTAPRYWLDLGNERLEGQVVLGQPIDCQWNAIEYGTISQNDFLKGDRRKMKPLHGRLPVITEMFPDLMNTRRRESNTPTCSVAEALDRQSLFVNDTLTVWAAQILDDLLRIGELRWHGAFINLATGRVNPIPVPGAESTLKAVA